MYIITTPTIKAMTVAAAAPPMMAGISDDEPISGSEPETVCNFYVPVEAFFLQLCMCY